MCPIEKLTLYGWSIMCPIEKVTLYGWSIMCPIEKLTILMVHNVPHRESNSV